MSGGKKLEVCNGNSQMEVRKWEDLSTDCLVNIFGRLGLESLILDVPFVCKSWYSATKSPLCWRNLDFSILSFFDDFRPTFRRRVRSELRVKRQISVTSSFFSSVILRSGGLATKIIFPRRCNIQSLILATNISPALKTLELPCSVFKRKGEGKLMKVTDLIREWKNLESLTLKSSWKMIEILSQIGIHCKNLVSLTVKGTCIGNRDATAIITHVPNIKSLYLRRCDIDYTELVMILNGCNGISYFDVTFFNLDKKCYDEIKKLASRTQCGDIYLERELSLFGNRVRLVTEVGSAL